MVARIFLSLIRWRWVVLLFLFLWSLFGYYAAVRTPIDALPDLSENQILVYTPWVGHKPAEIETAITHPLSLGLQSIQDLKTIRGSSDPGFSLIHLIFDDQISHREAHERVLVQLKKINVKLPSGVQPQVSPEGIPTGQILWYTIQGNPSDLIEIRRWQDEWLSPKLLEVEGVAEVASVGGMKQEVAVEFDSERLAKAQIPLTDLNQQLQDLALSPLSLKSTNPKPKFYEHELQTTQEFVLRSPVQGEIRIGDLGTASIQPVDRNGVFECDGNEMVAGIVHLKNGFQPKKVIYDALKVLEKASDELPESMRLRIIYSRLPLIDGAVRTLRTSILEAVLITIVGVALMMRHFRSSIIIAVTVPLSVLGAFASIHALNAFGAEIQINIMSLAGIVISIGVLVDSSIVMVDNVVHQLRKSFGDEQVTGDISSIVATASAAVFRPAFFAILLMMISFLPIFALQGIDGRMYRPLAWTKTLTLISLLITTVGVVPVLSSLLIRGKLRDEKEHWLLAGLINYYRQILTWVLDEPRPLIAMLSGLIVLGSALTGNDALLRISVLLTIVLFWYAFQSWFVKMVSIGFVLLIALALPSLVTPITVAMRLPLDEGMIMDMPISTPRMTVQQATDDLKARNMQLCRFPEVLMVSGKAGRADTAFDPAPIDMIESMLEFRSGDLWPRRKLNPVEAKKHALAVIERMIKAGIVDSTSDLNELTQQIVEDGIVQFDSQQREFCWQSLQAFEATHGDELSAILVGDIIDCWKDTGTSKRTLNSYDQRIIEANLPKRDKLALGKQVDALSVRPLLRAAAKLASVPTGVDEKNLFASLTKASYSNNFYSNLFNSPVLFCDRLTEDLRAIDHKKRLEFVRNLDRLLADRSPRTWTLVVANQLFSRLPIADREFMKVWDQVLEARFGAAKSNVHHSNHSGLPSYSRLPIIDPYPLFDEAIDDLSNQFAQRLWLEKLNPNKLTAPQGELDQSVRMPGWANVWTRPIQNRVDMLATGVNSEIGIRVLGSNFDEVVRISEKIASEVGQIEGAINVLADPVRDKEYLEFKLTETRLDPNSIDAQNLELAVQAAANGVQVVPKTIPLASIPIRWSIRSSNASGRNLLTNTLLPVRKSGRSDELPSELISWHEVAQITRRDGPATIKTENGSFRNYVRLNVVGSDPGEWVDHAKDRIAEIPLPQTVKIEWTGQFEHVAQTKRSMWWIVPACIALMSVLLYFVFYSLVDAMLMISAVPGALAGGAICQWFLGYPFSLAVGVGYISCLGMAAATSIVMLVYMRAAMEEAGGLSRISLQELKTIVISGATQRVRPKFLTELAMILGLVPMLWSSGVGSDVIRPMAAPVLGASSSLTKLSISSYPTCFTSLENISGKKFIKTTQ